MRSFLRRNLNGIVLVALVFGQVLGIGQQVRAAPGETRLQYWTNAFLLPLQRVVQATFGYVGGALDRYVWLVGAAAERRELEAETARLQMENHFLRQKLLRFESRTHLDAFSWSLPAKTLPARVIAQGPSRSAKEVFLNRGSRHGVRPGLAVITPEGIVGKVEAVYGGSSMVLLINDSDAGAGVVFARSGEPGVLRGTSRSTCRIDYVGPHVRVAQGEVVYTSGLDGIYPRGLPVGRVAATEAGVETQAVEVVPFALLDRLDGVLVVLESDYDVLPDDVRTSLSDLRGRWAEVPDKTLFDMLPTDADRIKLAYRRSVGVQGKGVGALSYTGPPDFSDVVDPLRARGGADTGGGEEPR